MVSCELQDEFELKVRLLGTEKEITYLTGTSRQKTVIDSDICPSKMVIKG